MKIICQNCYEILAERDREQGTVTVDPKVFPHAIKALSDNESLLTLSCPKCDCKLQIKV